MCQALLGIENIKLKPIPIPLRLVLEGNRRDSDPHG